MILQFGNFDDFVIFGQVCKQFNKCRSIDNVCVQLNDYSRDGKYYDWLITRKWKIVRMKGHHVNCLQIVTHHLQVLHVTTWSPWRMNYLMPENLVELSITFSTLPLYMNLTHCSNLVKLSLITSENIDHVAYPLQLEYLDLHNSDVRDILSLTQLARLIVLNVSNCENLCTLPVLPNVEKISIGGTTGITGFQLEYFLSEMNHLTVLDFSNSHILNNIHLILISKYKNLQSLNISDTQFPLDLFCISRMPNLQELNINGLAYYTTNASIRFLSYLPKLKRLHMARCLNVTTVSVLNRIKTLEYLDISECPMIEYANLPKHIKITCYPMMCA
jgi:hypothetical protein